MKRSSGARAPRRPPAPSESHAAIEEWIGQAMPGLRPIVTRLDELIRRTIPGLQYAVKWKKAYYGLPAQGWIIELAAYDVSVNVVFFAGARLDPPPPLGEGSRYVKLTSAAGTQEPALRSWIEQAARMTGWQ